MKFSFHITGDIVATILAPVDQHGVSGSTAPAIAHQNSGSTSSPGNSSGGGGGNGHGGDHNIALSGGSGVGCGADDDDDGNNRRASGKKRASSRSPSPTYKNEDDDDDVIAPFDDEVFEYLRGIELNNVPGLSGAVQAYQPEPTTLNDYEESLRGIRFDPQVRAAISNRTTHAPTNNNTCNCEDCKQERFRTKSTLDYSVRIDTDDLIKRLGVGEQLDNSPHCKEIINDWNKDIDMPGGVSKWSSSSSNKKNSSNKKSTGEDEDDIDDDVSVMSGGDEEEDEEDVPWYESIIGTNYDPDNIDRRVMVLTTGVGIRTSKGSHNSSATGTHLTGEANMKFLKWRLIIAETWRSNSVKERGNKIIEMINDLRGQGYEFLFIRKIGDNIEYEAPPKVVEKAMKTCQYDAGSLRTKLYNHIKHNFVGKKDLLVNRLKLEQNEKSKKRKEIIDARINQNKLGTINPHWVPSCYDEIKDSVMSDDYKYNSLVADKEIEAATIAQNVVDEEGKGRDTSMTENKHVSTLEAFLSNLDLFEALLDGTAHKSDWEELNNITGGRAAPLMRKNVTKEFWDGGADGQSNAYLADLAYQILKVESKQCYYCNHHPVSKGADGHLDHLEIYHRHERVSHISMIREALLESFKCKFVCAADHRRGAKHDEDYDKELMTTCQLVYGPNFGSEHRTLTEVLELQEVQLFVLEGKKVGGFEGGHASLDDMKVILWNIFGIHYKDVLPCTEEDYNEEDYNGFRRRRVWNSVFTQVLVKLSVKCEKCGKCFRNIHPLRRSGVELNHLNERAKNPGLMKFKDAEKQAIDTYIDQLRKGKGDAICKYCHEVHYNNPDTN